MSEPIVVGPWRLHPDSVPGAALAYGARMPSAPALAKGGDRPESFTHGELRQRAAAIASLLRARGVPRGGFVVVHSENRPAWVAAYVGVQTRGATPVPFDALLGPAEIAPLLDHCRPKAALVSRAMLPKLTEAMGRSAAIDLVFCLDGPAEGATGLDEALAGLDPGAPEDGPAPDDLAVVIYTSGTTGKPKGVMLTHGNLVSNGRSALAALAMSPADSFLSVLPLHHTFECTGGLLCAMAAGARVTYARSLKSKELLEDLASARATILLGVPLLYEKMIQGIQRAMKNAPPARRAFLGALGGLTRAGRLLGLDLAPALFAPVRKKAGLGNIRCFVSGAAALSPDVFGGFRDLGIKVVEGYGLTETSPVLTLNPLAAPRRGSVGKPIPNVEVAIRDAGPDGVGEIWARGPNVMRGYYKNQEATDQVLQDGWFRTGDLGRFDGDGYLSITGRAKSLIVTAAGKNVYPEEIETEIEKSPYVAEVLVVPRKNEASGREEVHAIVFPDLERIQAEKGLAPSAKAEIEGLMTAEVRRWTAPLAEYKRVKGVSVRDEEFPKTSTKKIKRFLFQ